MPKILVTCKFYGFCKHDYGLFDKELGDCQIDVEEDLWNRYVKARAVYGMLDAEISAVKAKKWKYC